MAEGTNIASAYVQIVPSAKGMGAAISKEIDGANVGESSGQSIGKKLLLGIGKIFTVAAVGKLVKDAIGEGSALQQSLGGVETLFGTAGKSMLEYTQEAVRDTNRLSNALEQSGVNWEKYSNTFWASEGEGISGMTDEMIHSLLDVHSSAEELAEYLHFEYDLDVEDAQAAVEAVQGSMLATYDEAESKQKAQKVVMENAAKAWKTAGLSANEYMETVTSFSASLIQSVGGDTEAAAQIADQAIIAMSDNANKFGTDMTSIQNAYQGFAKQNYTMLDNLKLGYGGTKEEMERLLEDASKLTGEAFDINKLSDVYTAIGVIQENLGVAGTTAAEASSTFTGSFSAMQASVKNLLGNLTLGEDIGPSLEALGESISTFLFDNLFPMIGNILMGLPDLLFGGGAGLIDQLVWRIVEEAPKLGEGALKLMLSLVDGVLRNIPQLLNAAFVLVGSFAKSLWDAITGYDWASYFRPILDKATEIWNGIKETVINLWNTVKGRFESLFASVKNIWEKIKNAIITPVKNVWEKIKEFIGKIKDIFSGLKLELPKIALPHFSVYGGKFPWGIGGSGEAPRFSVDWYDKGGIFREPSIIGVGEKRPEFVGALDDLRDIVREEAGGKTEISMNIYGTEGQNINELADRVMARLQFAIDRKERQFA